MLYIIKQIYKFFGIDGAIGYTILSRIISAAGGLITLIFIALFLTTEEQGYYYTFGSIIALQVFFELGLNGIITQYAAHEVAHLTWKSETEFIGSLQHISRLSSLLHFCIKVFTSIAFFLFIILALSGYIFFTRYHHGNEVIAWKFPWLLIALTTSLMFVINPLLAFLEGLGKVKEIAQIRFLQQLSNVLIVGGTLIVGGKLWALGIASFISFCILTGSIFFSYRKKLLLFVYKEKNEWVINYWNEIFPYQWKIALSWISGYFIFQLFNPVLFATEGPVVAGQMGMTMVALNGISSLSMSWISTKVPTFSSLIALKNYNKLDQIFNKTLKQLSLVNLSFLSIFIVAVYFMKGFNISIANRFLPFIPLLLLCVIIFINQFVYSWATYLRCHKQEPYLITSITMGISTACSTIIMGKYYGLLGITIGYTVITILVGLIWGYSIFRKRKMEWHKTIIYE